MEMVSAVGKAKTMRVKNEKMSLEDYLLLIHSHSHLHLTVVHLNQLINLHGYKKIHKVPKKILIDAVSTLNLVDPSRSTLKDYISPLVSTSLDDVIADLNELRWQECCVTSVETLNSWKHAVVFSSPASPPPLASPRSNDAVRHRKTLDPKSNGVVSAPNGASPLCLASDITVDHPVKKLVPRKKRKRLAKGAGAGSGGANHRALDCVSYGSTSS